MYGTLTIRIDNFNNINEDLREVISFVKAACIEKIAYRLSNLESRFQNLEEQQQEEEKLSLTNEFSRDFTTDNYNHKMKEKIHLLQLENNQLRHRKISNPLKQLATGCLKPAVTYCQMSFDPYEKLAMTELRDLEIKVEKIEELNYLDFAQVQRFEKEAKYIRSNLDHILSVQKDSESKLYKLMQEVGLLKTMDRYMKEIQLYIDGMLGSELGLSSKVITDDQITVSDYSVSELKYARLGVANWNPTKDKPWMEIDFRKPTIVKTIQFYSPSTFVGSSMIIKYCTIAYKDNNGNEVFYDEGARFVANTRSNRHEFLQLNPPIETFCLKGVWVDINKPELTGIVLFYSQNTVKW